MNVNLLRRMGVVVMSAALWLQAPIVWAEIVTTDEMAVQNQTDSERTKVQSFLDRTDVKERLQALGVKGLVVKDRVAALSDEEVHALAQKIDTMPAGGNLSSLSNSDWTVILLLLILVAIIV